MSQLKFTKSHEWIKEINGKVLVGISDHAQHELGELVFVNLPQVGDTVTAGTPFGDVESVKAVSDIFSPVSGVVSKINEELLTNPAKINEAPYDAWFIEVENVSATEETMCEDAYKAFVASSGDTEE